MNLWRTELLPGVFFSALQTKKFKSGCLSLSLLTGLDRDTVSMNALLPRVLARGTLYHPDQASLDAAGDRLYGARVNPALRRSGEILTLGFTCGFPEERFVPGRERVLEPAAELLGELLLSPATKAGLLRREYVESEKQKLAEDIRARINDKRWYAMCRLTEEMCAFEAYGIAETGDEAGALAVTHRGLTHYYHDLLKKAPMELFYCGAAEPERVADCLAAVLSTLPREEPDLDLGTEIRLNTVAAEPRYLEEEMEVSQASLCLGFRLGECMEDPDFAAIRVFNELYGGSVNGRLYSTVREKLALCYSVSSVCDSRKGLMLAYAGLDSENARRAGEEMEGQLAELAAGRFSTEELESAKASVSGDLRTRADSPWAMEDFCLSQILLGLEDTGPLELAEQCRSIDAEAVRAVAESVRLDMVYLLRGGEREAEDDAAAV